MGTIVIVVAAEAAAVAVVVLSSTVKVIDILMLMMQLLMLLLLLRGRNIRSTVAVVAISRQNCRRRRKGIARTAHEANCNFQANVITTQSNDTVTRYTPNPE